MNNRNTLKFSPYNKLKLNSYAKIKRYLVFFFKLATILTDVLNE